jgi:hypothetical protein
LRCTLTTPEVSTTNAETGYPLALQASIAAVAASTARASGSVYPDSATCAAAEDRRALEAHMLKEHMLKESAATPWDPAAKVEAKPVWWVRTISRGVK